MAKVHITGDCWLWTGAKSGGRRREYGAFRTSRPRRQHYAHRWIFEEINAPIPDGHVIRHTCDNPLCVSPAHMLTGTQKENVADAVGRGRMHQALPGTSSNR